MAKLALKFVDSIEEIGCDQWNGLTGTENPFTRYEFLHALEKTGCTTARTGWTPFHVVVYQASDEDHRETDPPPKEPLAIMPLYLKDNSWGEYVFDWSWANAYQSHGLNYYPKFVTAVPFTPSVGQRVFTADSMTGADESGRINKIIVEAVKRKAEAQSVSSWHVLFPTELESEELAQLGMLSRVGTQFQWTNRGYRDFEDFLSVLNSRKRKSIRKERKRVQDSGITFLRTEGGDISPERWEEFYGYYQSTYLMRGQQGYLSLEFFKQLGRTMPEQLILINAVQNGINIAAALFFKNTDSLFGRYWGSGADYEFLHFETCYYQGQDYAIEHGIRLFDSGAQGEHKIQRGFEPIFTHSSHWLAHPGFADAIDKFLKEEKPHIEHYKDSADKLLPFKITES